MPLYRGYARPDNPAIYRPLTPVDAPPTLKYSRALKTACMLAAGPQPQAPSVCPRCYQIATFDSRLCFKYGLAGAWNMLCRSCHKVHIPVQVGPTEEDLENIESIRDHDHRALQAKKDAQARKRTAKKATKDKRPRDRIVIDGEKAGKCSPTSDSDQERTKKRPRSGNTQSAAPNASATSQESESESGGVNSVDGIRPFGIINNGNPADALRLHTEAVTVVQSRGTRTPAEIHAEKRKRGVVSRQVYAPEGRSILLVLWEQSDQGPFIDRVTVPAREELFLFHHPRIRAIPAPTHFEKYVFGGNVWSPVPWDITPIEVLSEDHIIFVRVMGVHCRDFGQQLHNFQIDRGHALPLHLRLAHVIYKPPRRHRWILVWDKDYEPPKTFLVDCSVLDDERANHRIPMPWLDLLHDAPFLLIWHELHTRWHGFHRDKSPHVPDDAPIVLLAHPGVVTRAGSGEAIAWLESWREGHKLADPESALTLSTQGSSRLRTSASDQRLPSNHAYGRKTQVPTTLNDRAISISDDEAELECKSASPVNRPATFNRVLQNGARTSTQLSATIIDISDDDAEFVQGSSSSPMKAKSDQRRRATRVAIAEREIIDLTDP